MEKEWNKKLIELWLKLKSKKQRGQWCMLPVRKERRRKKSIRKLVTIQLLLAATRHKKNLIFWTKGCQVNFIIAQDIF
jgi:hypothetical protein